MSLGWSDLTSDGKKYFSDLEKLANMVVQVGFQANMPHGDDDISIAEIAAYNEYGDSRTPARPFMKQSFENHESELQAACDHLTDSLASGNSLQNGLEELGVFLKGLVQEEILEGNFAANSPATIAMKGSNTPLIDTGLMRQSVNYVIKSK